jgi:glutamate dehydrogenase
MPLPRPLFEIFICSPRLEAVHLRFGPVARGGIRWSDRPQDFRTEVLGLVKAQQVKNAVIVPVGAKGGFVPKRLPAGNRDAIQAEAIAVYKIFMSTLLDLTDNLDLKGVVAPARLSVTMDDPIWWSPPTRALRPSPDIANGITLQERLLLDDAFASGGSAGYDHRKWASRRAARGDPSNAISAKWMSTSPGRRFRSSSATCRGRVYSNGMLRERTIRLVAAFDHRDIFIDPNPDPERSFERSTFVRSATIELADFDRISFRRAAGFSRAPRRESICRRARTALGLAAAKTTPQEIMNAILKAPVDLLWFGGIGTYVRASSETDESVGDRANDGYSAVAAELRARVICEGANLGLTQRAASSGLARYPPQQRCDRQFGRRQHFDVEVNLKIALSIPLRDGRLTRSDRDILLAGMTDEVASLVLRNNYQQTLALSLVERRGLEDLGFQHRLIQPLEKRQLLDRAVEFLPTDMEIVERRRRAQPLTRPELAVLLAYAKLSLHEDLLHSDVPDDPYLARELIRYFPRSISSRFPDALAGHRLRRDIIATRLANSMINRGGPAVVVRIADQTGATVDRIAAAFAAVRDSFGLADLNKSIEMLDDKISGTLQLGLFAAVQNLLLDRIVWFLRNAAMHQLPPQTLALRRQPAKSLISIAELARAVPRRSR